MIDALDADGWPKILGQVPGWFLAWFFPPNATTAAARSSAARLFPETFF